MFRRFVPGILFVSGYQCGETMAVKFQGAYVLVSRPRYKTAHGAWLPYASVTWNDEKGFHRKRFRDFKERFHTEEEAITFGFAFVSSWIWINAESNVRTLGSA